MPSGCSHYVSIPAYLFINENPVEMTNPKQMQENVPRTIKFALHQLVAWKNSPELGSCQSSHGINMLCDLA